MASSIGLSEPCPDRFKGSVGGGGPQNMECVPNSSISGLVDGLVEANRCMRTRCSGFKGSPGQNTAVIV